MTKLYFIRSCINDIFVNVSFEEFENVIHTLHLEGYNIFFDCKDHVSSVFRSHLIYRAEKNGVSEIIGSIHIR